MMADFSRIKGQNCVHSLLSLSNCTTPASRLLQSLVGVPRKKPPAKMEVLEKARVWMIWFCERLAKKVMPPARGTGEQEAKSQPMMLNMELLNWKEPAK